MTRAHSSKCWLFHHWSKWSIVAQDQAWVRGWQYVIRQRRDCDRCGLAQFKEQTVEVLVPEASKNWGKDLGQAKEIALAGLKQEAK